jgi:hypothetical protein
MQYAVRPYVAAGIAILSAGCVTAARMAPPVHEVQLSDIRLVDNVADIMAGSGTPIPSPEYVSHVFDVFLQSQYPNYTPEPVFYPAGNYALYTGVKSLPLDTSEAQGAQILDYDITQQVSAGSDVVVKTQSQSSTIAGMVMSELASQGVSSKDVSFVITGDPNLPDGGLFERFAGLSLPSLGITFNGPTPSDLYPTTIYTLEYDGFADVPRYPIDIFSDLNSLAGIYYVHPTYDQVLTTDQILPVDQGGQAIQLPTVGDTMTTYYMLPTKDLPLLEPLRSIPVVGKPLADLVQPDLRVLVNLGYGDPDYGWSQGPANVPTKFGLFPSTADLQKVPALLAAGTQEGMTDFTRDVSAEFASAGSSLPSLATLTDPASATTGMTAVMNSPENILAALSPDSLANDLVNGTNAVSGALSAGYATLLPTADVANALLTSLPAYDVSLFAQGLQAGDIIDAIGQPIAADTYLVPLAGAFETFAIVGQISTVIGDLASLIP